MKYTDKQKKKIKSEILKGLEDGTYTLNMFSEAHGMDRKTVRRWILQDKKLSAKVEQYNKTRAEEEVTSRESKKKEKKTGQSQTPFETQEVENDTDDGKGTAVVTTRSLDIKTIDDALRVAEVDLDVWEVERSKINSWEVTIGVKEKVGTLTVTNPQTYTNFQVTLWLRRKKPFVLAFEDLIEKMKTASPVVPPIARPKLKKANVVQRELEISLADIHLGLRCIAPCSDVDWTPDIADKMVMAVIENLLALSISFGPFEQIVFPFGNDFMHTDNVFNTTTAGTTQPEADSWRNTMLHGEILAMAMINRLKEESRVKIIVVPGNHAMHTEISMGRTLKAYYHNDKNVEVDANLSPYKFHRYGVNLLGFEHGHSIRQILRLSGLMANECPQWWAETKYREWHCGDQHRKGSGRPSVMAEQGVGVEFLPSLVPANEWHKLHAFSWQKRIGMSFVWDKTAGPIARLQSNIDSYTNKIMD